MPAVYQADVWCDSCAEQIKAELRKSATPDMLQDWENEQNYDSDEFPKYMQEDEEADCPQHCAAGPKCLAAETLPSSRTIGCLLSTSLTTHGADYVRQAVAEGGEVAEFWRSAFDWVDCPDGD